MLGFFLVVPARAAGRALDGAPVGLNNAQAWCISPREPLPNWDGPAHPEIVVMPIFVPRAEDFDG